MDLGARRLPPRIAPLLETDGRIVAAWLEGSSATESADDFSDLDLHIAVDDAHWDEVSAAGLGLLAALGEVRASNRIALGPNVVLVYGTLAGPSRIDLYIERASGVAALPRRSRPRVVFDKAGVLTGLNIQPGFAIPGPRQQLTGLLNAYLSGYMWPARLLGRDDPETALTNALIVLNQFWVPAVLLVDHPAEAHRELLAAPRFLSPERRADLRGLTQALASGYEKATRTGEDKALREAHAALFAAVTGELHAACMALEVPWPRAAFEEAAAYLGASLGITFDLPGA